MPLAETAASVFLERSDFKNHDHPTGSEGVNPLVCSATGTVYVTGDCMHKWDGLLTLKTYTYSGLTLLHDLLISVVKSVSTVMVFFRRPQHSSSWL